MDDIELLDICKRNHKEGLEYVIERYVNLVYSIVSRKIGSKGTPEDVKECVSDVFLAFYQQTHQINIEKGSMKGYLAKIANHKAIDMYRRLTRLSNKVSIDENLKNYQDNNPDLAQQIINKEEKKQLLEAIHALGEPDREIFIRKYYWGQKTKEIAKVLNLQDNTVDKKISRGLKKLKLLLGGVEGGEEQRLQSR